MLSAIRCRRQKLIEVRSGSKPEVANHDSDVRYAPESGSGWRRKRKAAAQEPRSAPLTRIRPNPAILMATVLRACAGVCGGRGDAGSAAATFTLRLAAVMLVTETGETMKAILRGGFLALAIMALAVSANAATERFGPFIYDPQSPKDLKLAGQIDPRSALNFRRAFDAHPEIERLYLDSGGGSVQTALLIADDVYRAGISTFIESDAKCYSACAFIFFAGKIRQVDGRLGVHQIAGAYGKADSDDIQINLSDIVKALNEYGVDPKVLEYMLQTSAGEMYIFTQQEIARLGLNRTSQNAPRPTEQAIPEMFPGPLVDGIVAYERGDYATALKFFRPLAEQGSAEAQFLLGSFYQIGQGVPEDFVEAAKWYRKAAEQGDASAQALLGGMYRDGRGVAEDYAEAVKWYRKAAEQGNAEAQNFLGVMYFIGRDVPQDYVKAAKWNRLAAEQGDAEAQYFLGVSLLIGKGVPEDIVQAHMWLNLAAAQGVEIALKSLNIAAGSMTPDQIAEAQRMASEWMEKHQR